MTFAVDNLASYISQIEAGTMRALAVTSRSAGQRCRMCRPWRKWGSGFRRNLVGGLRHADRNPPAIVDKFATAQKRSPPNSRRKPIFGCRARLRAPRPRPGFRRQGDGHVARGGAPLRSDAAVRVSAFACSQEGPAVPCASRYRGIGEPSPAVRVCYIRRTSGRSTLDMNEKDIPLQIAILLYPGVTALDAVGPAEVLSRIPLRKCDWSARDEVQSSPRVARCC